MKRLTVPKKHIITYREGNAVVFKSNESEAVFTWRGEAVAGSLHTLQATLNSYKYLSKC